MVGRIPISWTGNINRQLGTRLTAVREPLDQGHDVAVIGAGPAGSSFVRTLRDVAPHLRVLVLDKARFPRDKVCGDALTHTSCPLVLEVFPELGGRLPTKSFTRRYTLRYPGGQVFSRTDQELDVIPRREFDQILWDSARHPGVTAVEGARVVDLLMTGSHVTGVVAKVDGVVREYSAGLVVAADGSNSAVRRKTRVGPEDAPATAVRQYVRGIPPTDDGLVFFIDPDHHGYFWFFPIVGEEGWSANVGWFGFGDEKVNPRHRLETFLADEVVKTYLGDGVREGEVKGAPLAVAPQDSGKVVLRRPLWGDGYVLIGDAAGLVHPFTGEGILFALHSGRRVAQLVAQADGSEPDREGYHRDVLDLVASSYSMAKTNLLFALPARIPRSLRRAYVGALPLLDATRKGLKQIHPAASRDR